MNAVIILSIFMWLLAALCFIGKAVGLDGKTTQTQKVRVLLLTKRLTLCAVERLRRERFVVVRRPDHD